MYRSTANGNIYHLIIWISLCINVYLQVLIQFNQKMHSKIVFTLNALLCKVEHCIFYLLHKYDVNRCVQMADNIEIQISKHAFLYHYNILYIELCIFQGRLNELMSQIRMQNHLAASGTDVNYQMDPTMLHEVKTVSKTQLLFLWNVTFLMTGNVSQTKASRVFPLFKIPI